MKDITLVIMAAGMGSRYGGLKQIDPIGANGEIILDYSVYDAIEAGFDKECDHMLLGAYLEREPTVTDEKHFLASKIYVDFLWTLWAKTRVPYDGQPMEDWAVERYTRLKSFINEYKAL